jgi:hypothetical protein
MDLTTRALLVLGLIVGLFVIAGIALAVGKSMAADNSGEAFDIGKKRRKRRKPKKVKAAKSPRGKAAETFPPVEETTMGFRQMRSAVAPPLPAYANAPSAADSSATDPGMLEDDLLAQAGFAAAEVDDEPQPAPRLAMGEAPPAPTSASTPLESIPAIPPAKKGGAVPFGGSAQADGEW